MGAQFWSVYVPTRLTGDDAVSATLEQVDAARLLTRTYADQLAWATTADEVEQAWATGRMASLVGAEGGHSINCSLGTLRQLHELGVRYLTLTHNANTPWADSATDRPVAGGLTAFGREVVREMNRIGMMVDLSHVSADTMRDALEVSEAPVIFSHSSARAVTDSPRNVPDDVLERGGARWRGLHGDLRAEVRERRRAPTRTARRWPRPRSRASPRPTDRGSPPSRTPGWSTTRARPRPWPTWSRTASTCARSPGSTTSASAGTTTASRVLPVGLEDVSTYPALLGALADRGWSADDLARLTCRNTLRVMREVEATARELQERRGPSLARIEDLDGA